MTLENRKAEERSLWFYSLLCSICLVDSTVLYIKLLSMSDEHLYLIIWNTHVTYYGGKSNIKNVLNQHVLSKKLLFSWLWFYYLLEFGCKCKIPNSPQDIQPIAVLWSKFCNWCSHRVLWWQDETTKHMTHISFKLIEQISLVNSVRAFFYWSITIKKKNTSYDRTTVPHWKRKLSCQINFVLIYRDSIF